MRFAEDDRARVPFALVGALLLVAAASVATTVSRPTPEPGPPDAAIAAEHATANARTAVHSAVATALDRGAANPVVTPADSPYGRVLNDSSAYRDALRVRAAVRVRRALAASTIRVGDATATLSLPAIDDPADLRAAKRRVALDGNGNGTVDVRVRNVSLVVRVDGRVVRTDSRTFDVTLASPAFVLHDRVTAFDARLDRGAAAGPGFGRQFAARLYGIAWVRGYAQYAGAPAGNVVASRHVALAANGAALASQRAAFGTVDAAGARAHRRALVRVGVRDATQQWSRPGVSAETYLDAVLGSHPGGSFSHATPGVPAIPDADTGPGSTLSVSVDATADDAFADLLAGRDGPSLDDALDASYDARLRPAVRTVTVDAVTRPAPEQPGDGWTLVETEHSRTIAVANGSASLPSPRAREVRVASHTRVVTIRRTVRATWERDVASDGENETGSDHGTESGSDRGNDTVETTASSTDRVRVGVAVHARHRPASEVAAPVPSAFRERSRLDANLVDVAGRAGNALGRFGGVDAIAKRAATRGFRTRGLPASGDWTNRTRRTVYRDVAALREDVRNVSVRVERGSVLTGDPPTADLLAAVRDRRAELAPVPDRYGSVADVASVAAQRAYLAHVERRLAARVRADERVLARARSAVQGVLQSATDRVVGGLAAVQRAVQRADGEPTPAPVVENHLVGDVDVAIAGAPSYLVVDAVDAERVPGVARPGGVHPLAVRNVNVFTIPSGDATQHVVDAVAPDGSGSEGEASLRTAVRLLERASDVPREGRSDAFASRRTRLRDAVAGSMAATRERVASTLESQTALGEDAATAAVAEAFGSYPSTTARARAVVDGSATARVVDEAARRRANADAAASNSPDARFRDATRTHVATALRRARAASEVQPPDEAVGALRGYLSEQAGAVVENATREFVGGARNATNESFLGLPLAPVPGYWYATANVWVVDVRGTYPTFAVRARNGTAGVTGATTYVRDGSTVALDVDGDGVTDRLGYADRVTARATVPVAVVVPPGKQGVGDRNMVMFENSPGWPCPVPDRRPGATDATVANASGVSDDAGTNACEGSDGGGERDGGGSDGDGCDRVECDGDLYPGWQRRGMFHEQRHDVDGLTVADLRAEYAEDLAAVVDDAGVDETTEATGLDRETVESIAAGDLPDDLTLEDAASVLALHDDVRDADTVIEMATDHLLLGMTTGVLDVDAVESDLAIDLDAKEVQQKIERRAPMTFDEYVHVQHVIVSRQP